MARSTSNGESPELDGDSPPSKRFGSPKLPMGLPPSPTDDPAEEQLIAMMRELFNQREAQRRSAPVPEASELPTASELPEGGSEIPTPPTKPHKTR